jgi:hypothetical protein
MCEIFPDFHIPENNCFREEHQERKTGEVVPWREVKRIAEAL